MSKLLIENAAVVTVDPDLGDFERASILIEDGAIVAVGPEKTAITASRTARIGVPGWV